MMKLLISSLLVLIAAVALALFIKDDPGYVLIAVGQWSIETTLALLVFVLVVLFVALYYTLRFVARAVAVPRNLGAWRGQRKEKKAQKALTNGLVELAEGHWKQAERKVVKYAEKGESPMLSYLAAARAAQEQGAEDRRDRYLKLAYQNQPNADIAVGLTQAELLLSQGKKEQALATLRGLHQLAPAHPQVSKPLARLLRDMGEWQTLLELLPKLRKGKIFDSKTLDSMTREAYAAQLANSKDVDSLRKVWAGVPKNFREDETLLLPYLQRLRDFGEDAEGEPLLRAALKRKRSDGLIRMYGLIKGPDLSRQLVQMESLLVGYEQDPETLLAAARLCLRNGLWGKARGYLEASVNAKPTAEGCAELGTLLDKTGDRDAALICYREALKIAPCCEPPVAAEMAVEHVVPAIEAPELITPPDTVAVEQSSETEQKPA